MSDGTLCGLSPDGEAERTHYTERRLFECLHAANGRDPYKNIEARVSRAVLQDGLSHALCSGNEAIQYKAAQVMSELRLGRIRI